MLAIVELHELECMKLANKLLQNPDVGVGKGGEVMSFTCSAAHTAQPPRQKYCTVVFHMNQIWGGGFCCFQAIISFLLQKYI